jgi:hypothetical protein
MGIPVEVSTGVTLVCACVEREREREREDFNFLISCQFLHAVVVNDKGLGFHLHFLESSLV